MWPLAITLSPANNPHCIHDVMWLAWNINLTQLIHKALVSSIINIIGPERVIRLRD